MRRQAPPRWLWHAIDHRSGTGRAYVGGRRQDTVFLPRQALLEPCGIRRFYPVGGGPRSGIAAPSSTQWGRPRRRKSTANTSSSARGASAEGVERAVVPRPNTGTISCWDSASIGTNLGDLFDLEATPLRHLPWRQGLWLCRSPSPGVGYHRPGGAPGVSQRAPSRAGGAQRGGRALAKLTARGVGASPPPSPRARRASGRSKPTTWLPRATR